MERKSSNSIYRSMGGMDQYGAGHLEFIERACSSIDAAVQEHSSTASGHQDELNSNGRSSSIQQAQRCSHSL